MKYLAPLLLLLSVGLFTVGCDSAAPPAETGDDAPAVEAADDAGGSDAGEEASDAGEEAKEEGSAM